GGCVPGGAVRDVAVAGPAPGQRAVADAGAVGTRAGTRRGKLIAPRSTQTRGVASAAPFFFRRGRMTWINAASHPHRHTGRHGHPDFTEFTAAAGRRAAPADVLHRFDQPAAGDGVVGNLAGVDALAGAG